MSGDGNESERFVWPPVGYRSGKVDLDAPVQATHLDAAGAKKLCVDLGYFQDSVLKTIVPGYACGRKSPMIHRGYYVRTQAIRRACEQFLRSVREGPNPDLPVQIVNLGAGLDTTYFWVKDQFLSSGHSEGGTQKDLVFFEVDFPIIVSKKTSVMLRKGVLKGEEPAAGSAGDTPAVLTCKSSVHGNDQVFTKHYRLVACDMRQAHTEFKSSLFEAGFNQMAHTLFLSECVLVYIQPDYGDEIIKTCREMCVDPSNKAPPLRMFCVYEQFLGPAGSRFGKEMVKNLAARGCPLLALAKYGSKEEVIERWKKLFVVKEQLASSEEKKTDQTESVIAYTLNQHYDRVMSEKEIARVSKLELLDELEEMRLIQDHYLLLIAVGNQCQHWDAKNVY